MSRLANREEVKKKFIKQLREFRYNLNNFDTRVYFARVNGKGVFVDNEGDADMLLYIDKAHKERPIDVLYDGVSINDILKDLDTTKGSVCKRYSDRHSLPEDGVTDDDMKCFISELYEDVLHQMLKERVEKDKSIEEEAEEILREARI